MKAMILCWLMAASVWAATTTNEVPTQAEQDRMFMETVMLTSKGFYAEAEVRLRRLVELHPDQPTFREMLVDVQAKLKAKEEAPATVLARKLRETIVPEVRFRGAEAVDVIEFLRDESAKLATDKVGINFVWQVPADAKVGTITLSLRKVPLLDVLNYVTQLAGVKYRVDPHAVVIYQPQPEPAPPPNAKPE